MPTQPTCAERIGDQLAGRIAHLNALDALADVNTSDALVDLLARDDEAGDRFDEILAPDGPAVSDFAEADIDDLRERAIESLYELPLAVTSKVVYRIDLSTGGPADWLEVLVSPASDGELAGIERITYHFADWCDHAELQLDGDDFEAARRFAEHIVPELA
jgi:hypothetical protein